MGIFPLLTKIESDRAARGYPDPVPEPIPFKNYSCYHQHEEKAGAEFWKEVRKGYVKTYATREELERDVGKITPSRIAALVKETATGTKTRLIHDMSRSGVNQQVAISERVVLPRALDVFASCLRLHARQRTADERLHFMVLDFADAFKHLKVDPSEQKYLTGWVAEHVWFV